MPLRDHFHAPLADSRRWEGVHGGWPMVIVQQLLPQLPAGYYAEPRVRLSVNFEVDVGASETHRLADSSGGIATAPLIAPQPTFTSEADIAEFDEYEVQIFDDRQKLVAAIEIVSPGNKDRPEARSAFPGKVASLLRRGVCTSIVDLVTERHFNLYSDALDVIGLADTTLKEPKPAIYAATLRKRGAAKQNAPRRAIVDTWFFPLTVGQPLPSIPLWLDDNLFRTIDLESSYEETCRTLRIA